MRCGELVPKFFGPGVPLDDGDLGACLLKEGHEGEHLVNAQRGYYLWIFEENFCIDDGKVCDCDFIECYVYRNITRAQAKKIIAKNGVGTD